MRMLNTFKRILEKKETKSGCTVHYVNDKLDGGKVITQKSFYLVSNSSELDLKKKTQNYSFLFQLF